MISVSIVTVDDALRTYLLFVLEEYFFYLSKI